MKKLFALMLALCLLCSVALAEEEVVEINWTDVQNDELEAKGQFQQIEIPDTAKLVYWIPSNLAAYDVSQIAAEVAPVAAFATEDMTYTVSVYALNVTSLEEYLTSLEGNGTANFKNVTLNGFSAIAAENEAMSCDMLIIPVTDTMVLVYNFTPLNGDADWDAVKAYMVASIQVAE